MALLGDAHPQPSAGDPPGPEDPAVAALIDRAAARLASGSVHPSEILADEVYLPAHEQTRFRELMRRHATTGPLTIVTPKEPGPRLRVRGTIRSAAGQPVAGALMYAYQTDSRGWYSARAPHVGGNSGDERHARLFGYLRSSKDGAYELRTVMPTGYPGSTLPAHIHVYLAAPAKQAQGEPFSVITEIVFSTDPRLTPEARARAVTSGFHVADVKAASDGSAEPIVDLQLPE